MLDDIALNILCPFFDAGVCVSLDIFPHVGLVWVAFPSSCQPKQSGAKGVQNGVIIFSLHVPGCVTADVLSCSVYPVCVSLLSDFCTKFVPVWTALSHTRRHSLIQHFPFEQLLTDWCLRVKVSIICLVYVFFVVCMFMFIWLYTCLVVVCVRSPMRVSLTLSSLFTIGHLTNISYRI